MEDSSGNVNHLGRGSKGFQDQALCGECSVSTITRLLSVDWQASCANLVDASLARYTSSQICTASAVLEVASGESNKDLEF